MLTDIAVWFGCNLAIQDPGLCVLNTILIFPGLMGLFLILLLYIIAIPIGLWFLGKNIIRYIRHRQSQD